MKKILTFYLVRHGMTEGNYAHRIMGERIDTPLTSYGIKNAETLGKELNKIKFSKIISSDLGRAFITAHIIAEKIGLENQVIPSKELREVNYGDLTYQYKDHIKKEYPEYKVKADYVFPGGESFLEMQSRVIKFIKKLEKEYDNKTILLVAHAGVIRAIICYFHGYDLNEHLNMRVTHEYIGKFKIKNNKLIDYYKIHE